MKEDRNKLLKTINFIISIFLILTILFLSYYIYLNIPRNPEKLNINNDPSFETIITSEVKQFYPNMKFNHNKISYIIGKDCNSEKRLKMEKAFQELSSNVPILVFYESESSPEIKISCTKNDEINIDEKHFTAGEGGAKEIIQTERFNVINKGLIYLHELNDKKLNDCLNPNIELHELMHVFGFGHALNENSLMFSLIKSCDQKLDDDIISELIRLYSEPNQPDLYFSNISVIKKGIYLDF